MLQCLTSPHHFTIPNLWNRWKREPVLVNNRHHTPLCLHIFHKSPSM
uniref:Uncharacterized protein n=1 Tax=Arundo donax TaxID=35708 RepID=A0A0A9A878_ARUDO